MTSRWFKDLLLPPLIVAVIGWIVLYVAIPAISKKDREITYTIQQPIDFLNEQVLGKVRIEVNDIQTSELFASRVQIENTGDMAIKEFPVRFVFEGVPDSLVIFNIVHETNPEYEFGKISLEQKTSNSVRLVYGLLNPGDVDIITFLTNAAPKLSVHAKAEEVVVKQGSVDRKVDWPRSIAIIAIIVSLLTSVLSYFISRFKVGPTKRIFNAQQRLKRNAETKIGEPAETSATVSSHFSRLIQGHPRPDVIQRGTGDTYFYLYSADKKEEILNLFPHKDNLAANGNVLSSTKQEKRLPRNLFNAARRGSQWSLDSTEGWLNATWQPLVNGRYVLLVNRTSGPGHDPWDRTIIKTNGQTLGTVSSEFAGNMVLIIDLGKKQPLLELNLVIQGRMHPGLAGIGIHPEAQL